MQINPGNPFFLLFTMVAEFTLPGHGEAASLGQLDNKTEFQMGFKSLLYWLDLKLQHSLPMLCCSLQQLFSLNVPRKSLVLHRGHREIISMKSPGPPQEGPPQPRDSSTNRRGHTESAGWFQSCCWQHLWFVSLQKHFWSHQLIAAYQLSTAARWRANPWVPIALPRKSENIHVTKG